MQALGSIFGISQPRQQAAPTREDPNVEEARRRALVTEQQARSRGATLLNGAMAPAANSNVPQGPGATLLGR